MVNFSLRLTTMLFALVCYAGFAQLACPAFAQTQLVQIVGAVRYADGSPANEVVVRLERLSGGYITDVRTDRLGKFRFTGLESIQYQVIIRHPGYVDIQREVNLVMATSENLQLALLPDPTEVGSKSSPLPGNNILDAKVPAQARKEFEKASTLLATRKKDKIEAAVVGLQKALLIYPDFLEAQLRLGAAYMDLEQWDKAETALRRTLEINPKTVNAYLALGEIYARQKKYAEAEQALSTGLTIEDRSWQGRFALARVYYARGDLARAARQVGLAIQLNASFPDAHFLAANIHLKVNNHRDALEQLQEYLRLAPKGEFAAQARRLVEKLQQ
jgi:tetratricopeptide (TPR) repeat protein